MYLNRLSNLDATGLVSCDVRADVVTLIAIRNDLVITVLRVALADGRSLDDLLFTKVNSMNYCRCMTGSRCCSDACTDSS